MRLDVLEIVKKLTLNDKKTLCQKALKLTEEVGELAKVVLPFENAAGTTHRFTTDTEILEEVADVILVALSIAYDLKYTDEDLAEMMEKKSAHWAYLQFKEEKNDKYPFEIHTTVETANVSKFILDCQEIGVKPIILDLYAGQEVIKDVMTSSVIIGNNTEAYSKAQDISNQLRAKGYTVCRNKIETVPWHPSAPCEDSPGKGLTINGSCYFESHVAIVVDQNDPNFWRKLDIVCEDYSAKLSKNTMSKKSESVIMATIRSYNKWYETFKYFVECFEKELTENGFVVKKPHIEYALFDTNNNHDKKWIGGK